MKSEEYAALFKLLTDTRLTNSIQKCRNFLHTGALEVYHNVRLKILPKRTSYKLVRMIIGSMLIGIEINANVGSTNFAILKSKSINSPSTLSIEA